MSSEWQGVVIGSKPWVHIAIEAKANGYLVAAGNVLCPQEFLCKTTDEVLELIQLILFLHAASKL